MNDFSSYLTSHNASTSRNPLTSCIPLLPHVRDISHDVEGEINETNENNNTTLDGYSLVEKRINRKEIDSFTIDESFHSVQHIKMEINYNLKEKISNEMRRGTNNEGRLQNDEREEKRDRDK